MKKTSKTTRNSGKPSIVFFGSGPVAKASLAHLAQHFPIEAVVTKPVTADEMAPFAPKGSLHTVTDKHQLSKLIAAKFFRSRLGIIVDFGIIVEQAVIDYFPLGIVNSHFSLLPQWRGADPISFAILSGQKKTGVSLMLIVRRLDEGPLLAQADLDIPPDATTPELTKELVELSNKTLAEILPLYLAGHIWPFEQHGHQQPTYSRKLTKEDGILDWHKPAVTLEREIRAFIGWPKSRTTLAGKDVVITEAHVVEASGKPGKPTVRGKELLIHCGIDALAIDRLKPAGKKEMTAEAFLAGYAKQL
jgi:methionyl-tRNA formyltransferase